MKTGDAIAAVATPIARMVGADCIDPETNDLRPESPCAQRKRMLNEGRYADAIWDIFWPSKNKNIMRYVITTTKQVAVEANSPEEAEGKKNEGKTLSLTTSVSERPTPTTQPNAGQRPINSPALAARQTGQ